MMYVSVVGEQESAILIYNYCNFLYVVKIIAIKLKHAVILQEIYSPSRGEDYNLLLISATFSLRYQQLDNVTTSYDNSQQTTFCFQYCSIVTLLRTLCEQPTVDDS